MADVTIDQADNDYQSSATTATITWPVSAPANGNGLLLFLFENTGSSSGTVGTYDPDDTGFSTTPSSYTASRTSTRIRIQAYGKIASSDGTTEGVTSSVTISNLLAVAGIIIDGAVDSFSNWVGHDFHAGSTFEETGTTFSSNLSYSDGDLVVVACFCQSTQTFTPPTGFTTITGATASVGGGAFYACYQTMSGSGTLTNTGDGEGDLDVSYGRPLHSVAGAVLIPSSGADGSATPDPIATTITFRSLTATGTATDSPTAIATTTAESTPTVTISSTATPSPVATDVFIGSGATSTVSISPTAISTSTTVSGSAEGLNEGNAAPDAINTTAALSSSATGGARQQHCRFATTTAISGSATGIANASISPIAIAVTGTLTATATGELNGLASPTAITTAVVLTAAADPGLPPSGTVTTTIEFTAPPAYTVTYAPNFIPELVVDAGSTQTADIDAPTVTAVTVDPAAEQMITVDPTTTYTVTLDEGVV